MSFKNSLALDSSLTDAKTGLGVTIVNGAGAPMEGIALLMDVVKKDPKNLKANMNLGLFAIKSGQFDKAITRFNDVINNIGATPEAVSYTHLDVYKRQAVYSPMPFSFINWL